MIRILLHPFIIFLFGVLVSFCLFYLQRRRSAKGLLIFSFGWLLICSFGFLPDFLLAKLECQYKPFYPRQNGSIDYNIIILGGGHAEDPSLPPNGQLHVTALGRLVEGIRILRMLPSSRLIVSGYSPDGRTTQAKILAKTAISLGVDSARIDLQQEPKNTFEEAEIYAKKHGNDEHLIVVTSASHMPRAIKMFKMMDINPIPAPTNYLIRAGNVEDIPWIPDTDNIKKMHTVIKEYIALWTSGLRYHQKK